MRNKNHNIQYKKLQLENQLIKASYDELIKAQEIANIGNWVLTLSTNDVYWSEQLYHIFECDPSLPPPPLQEQESFFTPESWKLLNDAIAKTASTGTPYNIEMQTISKSGKKGWLLGIGRAFYDENGEITHLRGIAQDITFRKEVDQKLEYQEQFNQKLTDISPSGIFIYDFNENKTAYINQQYQNILGWTLDEINTMNAFQSANLYHPEDKEAVLKHIAAIKEQKKQDLIIEYRFRHKEGHWVWCYSIDSPFDIDDTGKVNSYIGIFLDISEKKRIEHDLNEAVRKSETANIYKDQFLANMSHEIRTPMNGIIGFADLLDKDNIQPEERKRFIEIIKSSSRQLLSLISDIIDVSKIEAGELQMNYEDCMINDFMLEIHMSYSKLLSQQKSKANLEIKYDLPGRNIDLCIKTDVVRLKQIITNLINNAIKYSIKGTIHFGYKVKNNHKIQFYVKDEGVGIQEDKLEAIFNRFEQLDSIPANQASGTGLGLSIVKGLLNKMQGGIEVKSEVGKGSEFLFTLPLLKTESKRVTAAPKLKNKVVSITKTKILLAEDNLVNIEYFKTLFAKNYIEFTHANNGQEALDIYKKSPNFDVILMDIRMPVMDGIDACKSILKINPKANIIAQTAFAMKSDAENFMKMGFVDYISKPIDKDELFEKIEKYTKT